MKQPVQRRLAAILAADVAGYSRLMGADEEGTLERLKAHRRQLVGPKIREHRGRIVKTTGDGMLVEFPSVVDAVRCAAEVQRAMVDRNAQTPEDQRITFRVGVNLGDIIVDGDDIYGDGVNIAARLEALAEPGGICISRAVRNQIRDKLPYPFEDMGEQTVKNIVRPVRADTMSAAAVAELPHVASPEQSTSRPRGIMAQLSGVIRSRRYRPAGRSSISPLVPGGAEVGKPAAVSLTAPRLSIVVLPFENLSNDPEQEYFADGITDDLTTDLSRIHGSFVIARNTAFTYKNKPKDVRQIGLELGVRYILEGSVRRTGDQVRVNVQLVDAETGTHLWADRFETDHFNLAEAQNEITGRLARSLNLELAAAVGRRVEQERAVDPDARDLVMRGWAWWYRAISVTNRQEALGAFERALTIDSHSVEARIGLATILVSNIADGWSSSVEQDRARAERLLLEALERDPNRSMAHYAVAMVRRSQGRQSESKLEFEAAITLDRNNARAYFNLGQTLMFLGQPEAGIPYVEKALRLNPFDPNTAGFYWLLGMCHLLLHHVDQAIDLLRKARAGNPRLFYAHLSLAGALGLRGDLDEARAALTEALKLKPEINSLARLRAYLYKGVDHYWALREKTINVGLRRAGFPDE